MANDANDDINRLSSLLPTGRGGLITQKKDPDDAKPKTSLLGLDRKRNERRAHSRRAYEDTPSHPGGVDYSAVRRMDERRDRDRQWRSVSGPGGDASSTKKRGRYDYGHGRGPSAPSDSAHHYQANASNNATNVTPSTHGSGSADDRKSWNATPSRATPSQRSSWEQDTPLSARSASLSRSTSRAPTSSYRASNETPRSSSGGYRHGNGNGTRATKDNDDDPFDELHRDLPNPAPPSFDPDKPADDADGDEFDRQFYLADDDEYLPDDSGQGTGRFIYESDRTKKREEEMARKRTAGAAVSLRQAKQSALDKDQQTWEENRLLSSGAAMRSNVDLDFSQENDTRVQLLVHQIQPPFLNRDGNKATFSVIREAVPTVRDATSDFARMAREGSVTLMRLREKKDRNTMRQKFWELGGSKMGNAMRVKEVGQGDDAKTKDGRERDATQNATYATTDSQGGGDEEEVDYKKSSGFAQHVKEKDQEKKSEFSRTKTIREQREYLPAFSVRDSLMQTIRENNIVIVVGETGSGESVFFLRGICILEVELCNSPSHTTLR